MAVATMTDSEVDDMIALLLDQRSPGSEAFEHNMKIAGASLAVKFAEQADTTDKSFAIVTSAQDREFFALGFAEALAKNGARVTISTLWNKFLPPKGFVRSTTILLAQHHDPHPERVDCVAYVCSSLAEDATVADALSRVSGVIEADDFLVFSLTGSETERGNLDDHLDYRDCPRPAIHLLEGDRSFDLASRGASIRKGLRDHLKRAYGWKGLAYIPQSLGGPKPDYVSEYVPGLQF
ncbi:hypothetical protein [Agrobacterium burrii]|uniref:Uncharacterized protein n=1 Tax=Agrobacterium burrii TaxID=2815339 RepID=A0ABS3EJY1_9HYPH|nr:hypothetical protein [Agrobacterium burrii]MBO0132284.1 hypothetical protein [Agrobacterium burrii]